MAISAQEFVRQRNHYRLKDRRLQRLPGAMLTKDSIPSSQLTGNGCFNRSDLISQALMLGSGTSFWENWANCEELIAAFDGIDACSSEVFGQCIRPRTFS